VSKKPPGDGYLRPVVADDNYRASGSDTAVLAGLALVLADATVVSLRPMSYGVHTEPALARRIA
jgi:hypothetical protein